MEVFLLLIIAFATLLLTYLRLMQTYWRRREIPHDPPHIVYGNVTLFRKTKHFKDIFDPVYKKFKGTGLFAGFNLFPRPIVVALDLDFIKQVLIRDFKNFCERGLFHNERDDPLTGNLFQLNAEKWRPIRQKLMAAFTPKRMKQMFPILVERGELLVQVLTETANATENGEVEVGDIASRFIADIIGNCVFGLDCNSLESPNAEFCEMGKQSLATRNHNGLVRLFMEAFPNAARQLRLSYFHPIVRNFFTRVVRDTIEYREKHNVKRSDIMDALIGLRNNNDKLSKSTSVCAWDLPNITAQAGSFFVAGFETSSGTIAFALYELAKHPEVQEKLRKEINDTFKRYNNELTYDGLFEMQYLPQVLSETLRKYPAIPYLMRKARQHYVSSDPKYYIEKGSWVFVPMFSIHYDPDLYPEPEKFDPTRFEADEIKKRHTCAYMPFGQGPRTCIGERFGKMQVSLGLCFLIRNFKFSFGERTVHALKLIQTNTSLRGDSTIYLKVERI